MSAKSEVPPAGAAGPWAAHPLTHRTRSPATGQQHDHSAGAIPVPAAVLVGSGWRPCWGQAGHTHTGHCHHRPRQRSGTMGQADSAKCSRRLCFTHLPLWSAKAAGRQQERTADAGRVRSFGFACRLTGRCTTSAVTHPASIVFPLLTTSRKSEAPQPMPLRVHRRPYELFSVVW